PSLLSHPSPPPLLLTSLPTRRSSDLGRPRHGRRLPGRPRLAALECARAAVRAAARDLGPDGGVRHARRNEQRQRVAPCRRADAGDRKSTRLNSSHVKISYAVFCLKKK